jgi:signal transduction histidine kinase
VRENRLFQLLSSTNAGLPAPTTVELLAGDRLGASAPLTLFTYFPVTCVLSLVSTMEDGTSAEVSIVGREGLVGLPGILGTTTSLTTARIQVSGEAMRLPTSALRAARNSNVAVHRVLDLYTEARLIQVAQTAACNRLHSVEARLARWLLGMYSRIKGDALTISQETISEMLGVHRPTVSATLHHFVDNGAIRRDGRSLIIASRSALESIACECYQLIERETERLFMHVPDEVHPLPPPAPTTASSDTSVALEATREIAGRLLVTSIREQEAREIAEAAINARDQFLAVVSHDLRTPLQAILSWCGILASRTEHWERGLPVIESNARAQLRLVEDLLDTVRITSSTLSITAGAVDLDSVLVDVLDTVKLMAAEKGVVIRREWHELPAVCADTHRIRQVLLNVVGNSLKFTERGGAIDVRASVDSEHVHITVQDTGTGITPDLLPHVFDRFRRGAPHHLQTPGLGLGLAIARAIVERHGGTMDIASTGENQGTTCNIHLPRLPSAAPRCVTPAV